MTGGDKPTGGSKSTAVTRVSRLPLVALLAANTISLVGNVITMIAIPWFVLQTTGSPAKTGVTGFFITSATVLAAFFGGAVVDRLGFKRTSILADIASGVTVALIPLLFATTGLPYWQLLVLVFAGAFLDAPGATAREALIAELAELGGLRLEQAGAAIQSVERGARMLGAPLAGLLIATVGAGNALWFDAASFGVSALVVALVVPNLRKPASTAGSAAEAGTKNYLADLKEGLSFIFRDALLLAVVLLVVISNFLDAPLGAVIYPLYAQQYWGSALNLGLMIAAGGGGSLVSAVLYGAVGHRLPRRALFFAAFAISTLRIWVLPLTPPFWVVFLVTLLSGLASGPINPILYALELERTPVQLRGRVLGTVTALAWIAIPLGVLLGGYALEVLDVRFVLVVIAGLYLATVLAFRLHPAMRGMDKAK